MAGDTFWCPILSSYGVCLDNSCFSGLQSPKRHSCCVLLEWPEQNGAAIFKASIYWPFTILLVIAWDLGWLLPTSFWIAQLLDPEIDSQVRPVCRVSFDHLEQMTLCSGLCFSWISPLEDRFYACAVYCKPTTWNSAGHPVGVSWVFVVWIT
jgi:hypothetical protein